MALKSLSTICIFLVFQNIITAQLFTQQLAVDPTMGIPRGLENADMDNDGDLDIVISRGWYENLDGLGTFSTAFVSAVPVAGVNAVFVCDMDDDNDLDVVVAYETSGNNNGVAWVPNTDGLGTLGDAIIITTAGSQIRDVTAADFDGDGDMDVAYSSYGEGMYKWIRNNGDAVSWGIPIVLLNNHTWALVVKSVDLDDDGDMDIVTVTFSNTNGEVSWFENTDGNGTFSRVSIASLNGNNASNVAFGDVDGDGDKDIVASFYSSNVIYWYRNDNNETFSAKILLANINRPRTMILEDFDSDGDNDLITASGQSTSIIFHKNNGSGTFTNPTVILNTLSFGDGLTIGNHIIAAGDFDGDNNIDFSAISNNSQRVAWFRNTPPEPIQYVSSGNFSTPCFGATSGSIELDITGGQPPYQISWEVAGLSGDSINNLPAGNYRYTITDGAGSTISDSVLITQPSALVFDVSSSPAYPDLGSISLTISGGTPPYSYAWSNGDTTNIITQLIPGGYFCTVTDSNGCILNVEALILSIQPIAIIQDDSVTNQVSCFGGNDGMLGINISGGIGPYVILWNTGDTVAALQNISAGVYSCTITDSYNVTATKSFVQTDPLPLELALSSVNAFIGQNNGSAYIEQLAGGTPDYQILWNTGATTDSINNLPPGLYSVTITDLQGCQTSDSVFIDAIIDTYEINLVADFELYPNPANNIVFINFSLEDYPTSFQIFDAHGKSVLKNTPLDNHKNSFYINSTDWEDGMYHFVSTWADGRIVQKKIIILH